MQKKNHYKIKSQKFKARERLTEINEELSDLMKEYNLNPNDDLKKRLKNLNNTKEQIKHRLLALEHKVIKYQGRKCSDHAIVRYFQRILGMNMVDLEKSIIADDRAEKVIQNGIVVTIQIPKKREENDE
jgi:hypothetical protein